MKQKTIQTKQDILFNIIIYALTIFGCLVVLYPLYFILIASISDYTHVLNGEVLLFPKGITLSGFKRILKYEPLWVGYKNSFIYAITGSLLSSTVTLFAAYPLSRNDFSGRKAFSIFLLITMFFQGGLIPLYIVVNALGLRNTYWILILVGSVHVMNLFIASSFFRSANIEEIFEASQIDGCTHFGYYFSD